MDINSLYTDLYTNRATDAKNEKLSKSVSGKDYSKASDEELMEVCKSFESYFVEQVLKQAMDVFTTGEEVSSGSMSTLQEYYKSNLIQEYASTITERQDMGIAKTLYEQMKRNYSTDTIPASEVENIANSDADTTSAVEAASTAMADED